MMIVLSFSPPHTGNSCNLNDLKTFSTGSFFPHYKNPPTYCQSFFILYIQIDSKAVNHQSMKQRDKTPELKTEPASFENHRQKKMNFAEEIERKESLIFWKIRVSIIINL